MEQRDNEASLSVPGPDMNYQRFTDSEGKKLSALLPGADTEIIRQHISASLNFDLIFTSQSLDPANSALYSVMADSHSKQVTVFVDSGVASAFPHVTENMTAYLEHYGLKCVSPPVIYPGGEMVKNGWHYVMDMMNRLIQDRMCRHSFCIALGGGALLDAAGFAASMVHRGIRLIRMPTTALSQDDSGVGVKNGINYNGFKNLIGAFSPPFAVINDSDFLKTLPPVAIRDGLAEAFKVAIIKDKTFFRYLCDNIDAIRNCDWPVIETAVKRSAILHLHHIGTGGDPMEKGESRPLDFGHWSAHKLESMSNHAISHGTGVSIGIAIDTMIAFMLGFISLRERDMIMESLQKSGMTIFTPLLQKRDKNGKLVVYHGIEEFREHLGGKLCITLPSGLGNRTEIHHLHEDKVEEAIKLLEQRWEQMGNL